MPYPVPLIAVIQGADSDVIQGLFKSFIAHWSSTTRIAGLIEEADGDAESGSLRSIADGTYYRLFQDLGAGSSSCGLDTEAVVHAGDAARRDVMAGCDLLILSKFGKLEAESRSGLIPAFAAAVERQIPILTSVAPRFAGAWARFADPLSIVLPADRSRIDQWWVAARTAFPFGSFTAA